MADEKPSIEEREINLKEREFELKERELKIKENETARSRWFNPIVLGLFVGAAGLIGNIFVTSANNKNTEKIERIRGQSTLILEEIKTGDKKSACNNLAFFCRPWLG